MKLRLTAFAMALAILGTFVLAPLGTSAAPNRGTGTATFSTVDPATGETISGTVSGLLATVNETGGIDISGLLTYTTGAAAGQTEDFTTSLVGAAQDGGCQILFLDLGPLFLDLLGLEVDLSQIVLDITAQPGPGNLLGNLLCAVTGLLDGNAGGNAVTNLLNRLFGLLGLGA